MATENYMGAMASGASHGKRRWIVLYWTFTLLLMAQLAFTGTVMILRPPAVTTAIQHLGYPAYFPVFLGMAKLLAVVALAQRWSATLSEWAYAGISFDLLAAGLSHLASHDPASEVAGPFFIMVLVALSYVAHGRIKRLNSTRP